MTFAEIASPLALRGLPVIRLRPQAKVPMDSDWPSLATIDPIIISEWSEQTPNANCGVVAKAVNGGVCIFETDDPEISERIRREIGGNIYDTYCIRSSPGRGHAYFSHSPASIALGNCSQDSAEGKELWSFRAHNAFVVSEGSIHPRTGQPYEAVTSNPIIPVPDWLIAWMSQNKNEKKKAVSTDITAPVIEGGRNNWLTSNGGKLRHIGLGLDEIKISLRKLNEDRCQPPLPDSEVVTISESVARYAPGSSGLLIMGTSQLPAKTVMMQEQNDEPVIFTPLPYPKFPDWVMTNTSIYEGLVKPWCEANSRYAEFMFMPAMTVLLNYVGTRVHIRDSRNIIPSLFLVLIGRKGKVIKSSSVKDAIRYFQQAGLTAHGSSGMANADAKSTVWTVGSPEAFGLRMSRTNCKNGILYYDELSTLTNKASIDSSNLVGGLLTLYESQKFQNEVKSAKDSFSLEPDSYCASLIACCTDKNFLKHWGRLAGNSSGLNDRFFFLLQPEKLKDTERMIYVDTDMNAKNTRKLIDKAIAQDIYPFTDIRGLQTGIKGLGLENRAAIRVEKFALGFAIDLGYDEIDQECVERALALAKYEKEVKKYLMPFEASTKEGGIQMEILHVLAKHNCRMVRRDLDREMHAVRYGTFVWNAAYKGLLQAGYIREEGGGTKGEPIHTILLRALDEEDDE